MVQDQSFYTIVASTLGSETMRFELDREITVTLLQLFQIIVDLVRNRSTTNIVEATETFKTHLGFSNIENVCVSLFYTNKKLYLRVLD